MSASKRPAPPQVAGPAEDTAKTSRTVHSTARRSATATVTHLPLAYSQQLIENADGPVPVYGSVEWQQLPDGSRVKVAAIVIAAEKWRTGKHLPELSPQRTNNLRRRIEEARRPRPGDHPGGPVSWDRSVVASGE